MKIEEAIKTAMAAMIERKFDLTKVTIKNWDEEFEKSYFLGCETCGHGGDDDSYVVNIWYYVDGEPNYYRYEGTFADLIKELDA